jgi:hypothetical protein
MNDYRLEADSFAGRSLARLPPRPTQKYATTAQSMQCRGKYIRAEARYPSPNLYRGSDRFSVAIRAAALKELASASPAATHNTAR